MEQPIKILFYSGHCEIVGGDAKYIFELVDALAPKKYDISLYSDKNQMFEKRALQWMKQQRDVHYLETRPVLFAKNHLDTFFDDVDEGRSQSVVAKLLQLHVKSISLSRVLRRIAKMVLFERLREDLHNYRVFKKIFQEQQPDIFHFNNGGYPAKKAGLWALLAARQSGVEHIVMTIQNFPSKKNPLRLSDFVLDRITRKCCDRLITVSEKLRLEMQQGRGFPLSHSQTIFHGLSDITHLDAEQIRSKKESLHLPIDAPLLMITSNLDEYRKGHKELFHALLTVQEKYKNIHLMVVGDGIKRIEFENLATSLGLSDAILFLGHRSDVAELNEIADIALAPSIAFEGIPYTIREAMRSAKPVITTDAGGCDEAVENGVNGFIVPQKSVSELAKALLTLLKDPELQKKMGQNSRKLFEEKFLLSDKVKEHEALYENIIRRPFVQEWLYRTPDAGNLKI